MKNENLTVYRGRIVDDAVLSKTVNGADVGNFSIAVPLPVRSKGDTVIDLSIYGQFVGSLVRAVLRAGAFVEVRCHSERGREYESGGRTWSGIQMVVDDIFTVGESEFGAGVSVADGSKSEEELDAALNREIEECI